MTSTRYQDYFLEGLTIRIPGLRKPQTGKKGPSMINIGRIGATIHFEPRDLWVGAYWKRKLVLVAGMRSRTDLHVYLTLVPTFPVHFVIRGKNVPQEGYEGLFK